MFSQPPPPKGQRPFSRSSLALAWWTGILLLSNVGCRFAEHTWRTAVVEPIQYSPYWYDKFARHRYRAAALEALEQQRALAKAERDDYVHEPFSPAHECGFVDGFVDYLEAGGRGEPPVLPPRKFWKAKFQNPDGYRATLDWFEGFRHGASVARASGLRQFITVPVSDAIVVSTTPYPYGTTMLPGGHPAPPSHPQPPSREGMAGGREGATDLPRVTRLPPVSSNIR